MIISDTMIPIKIALYPSESKYIGKIMLIRELPKTRRDLTIIIFCINILMVTNYETFEMKCFPRYYLDKLLISH
jgi:hypothetical protein